MKKILKNLIWWALLIGIAASLATSYLVKMAIPKGQDITAENIFSYENIIRTVVVTVIIGILYWLFSGAYKEGRKLDEKENNKDNT